MRKVILSLFLTSSFFASSQVLNNSNNEEELNFESEHKEFKYENNFDGILNYEVHSKVSKDKRLNFSMTWDNDYLFASKRKNSFANFDDTLWLCVGDTLSNDFRVPYDGYMTSHFGPRHGRPHNGVDLGLRTGDMIYAAWSGKVRYAKFNSGGYGNLIVIRHHNGLETFYAHLSKILVLPNQDVVAGDPIGLGGSTGRSTGPHLHFEVRFYDIPINPEHIIDFSKRQLKDPNLFVHKDLFKGKLPAVKSKTVIPDVDKNELDTDHEAQAGDVLAGVAIPVADKVKTVENKKIVPKKEFRKYYKVKSGDNLTKIANLHGTTLDKVCQLNGFKASRTIEIGQLIRVR